MSASNPRIEVKDAARGAWFGAREEAKAPVRSREAGWGAQPAAAQPAHADESRAERWVRRGRRILIDLVVVLAAMTAVPVVLVKMSSAYNWSAGLGLGNTRAKTLSIEPLRQFGVPSDPSITPLEAGRSLTAMQPVRTDPQFPIIEFVHPAAPWLTLQLTPEMFPSARPNQNKATVDGTRILSAAAAGLSPAEMAYLRELATAPVWRDFDRVARASAMDILGGTYAVPFKQRFSDLRVPHPLTGTIKEMAYSAISRAAYHLASGRKDSAETILRSIISYGFAVSDNSHGLGGQMIGRTVVDIGRIALEQFYTLTRDPKLAAIVAVRPPEAGMMTPVNAWHVGTGNGPNTVEEGRQELLARATDPREMRGARYTALEMLSFSSCTNVRELLFGQRADISRAFETARRDLARYPSEQSLIDVIRQLPNSPAIYAINGNPFRRAMLGSATIAGAVLRNPRLAQCTWYVTEGSPGF